ncbi:MAG: hypothetical protein KatS3mg028_0372 [Bacteroidia bacterium]|nr:MAG: hypothetical protein KatS3mg028_0372 [Bacteroidia bacterium]
MQALHQALTSLICGAGPEMPTYLTPVRIFTTVTIPGTYYVQLPTLHGCASQTFGVVNGSINADFTPNPSSGFASSSNPLNVSFTNNSYYGNPANLTYYWSFGNGGTVTTVANPTVTTPGTSTQYTSPGTYTVVMIMQNGTCTDTLTE